MTLCLPSPDLQILIRESFNEHLETRFEYLNHIKDWLRKQPHLPDEWGKSYSNITREGWNFLLYFQNFPGEVQILSFLRSCNYSLEITKRKLDKYFTVRAALPEFFENWDIKRPELVAITKIGWVLDTESCIKQKMHFHQTLPKNIMPGEYLSNLAVSNSLKIFWSDSLMVLPKCFYFRFIFLPKFLLISVFTYNTKFFWANKFR